MRMVNRRWMVAHAAVLVVLGLAPAATAQRGGTGTFITSNTYGQNPVWDFVRPQGGGYPLGAKHYVRAEVTRNANCQQPVVCDTTITAVPSLGSQTLKLYPNGANCFWRAE